MSGHKRGKLSTEEEQFILASKDSLTIEEIAAQINRTVDPVKRFLAEHAAPQKGMSEAETNDAMYRKQLKSRFYWKTLTEQFNDEELEYFTKGWIAFMVQFSGNVVHGEELEIKQWLTLEILCNRCRVERFKSIKEIDRLNKIINEEYKKEPELRVPELHFYEDQVAFARASMQAYSNDELKFQTQIKDIKKDLKATRIERVKKLEEGKTSFLGIVKMLEDESIRQSEGFEAAVMSLATKKAKQEYGQPHQFLDGKFARPILNNVTVNMGDDEDGTETREDS